MQETIEEKLFIQNWMSVLYPVISGKRITDLTLPGSHDANTFSISKRSFGSSFCRCQNLNIYEQAMLGVRFFDLRYGASFAGRKIVDKHGPLRGGDFFKAFEDLSLFLTLHPKEF